MEASNYKVEKLLPPWKTKNYSHSYKESSNRLCFETGYFGLKIDVHDLSKILFRIFEPSEEISYFDAISKSNRDRMENSKLTEEELVIEIIVACDEEDGKRNTYRASSHTSAPRLWESGKIAQHYDFRGVEFRKKSGSDGEQVEKFRGKDRGEVLQGCDATFYVLVWPNSVTFTIELGSSEDVDIQWWSHGFGLKLKLNEWILEKNFDPDSIAGSGGKISASLQCNIDIGHMKILDEVLIEVSTKPEQELESKFSKYFNCFLLGRPKFQLLKRSFKTNYTDIRDYDVFEIRVKNNNIGTDAYVPTMLFVQELANPTGCCPILCDENYIPTGIPVQLSKNWHEKSLRNYGRFYCFLPAKGNGEWTTYYMRIVYGFYGTLPSASHSNLSLVGYSNHGGRWEQLAIGCWGETYCMDIDMDCVQNTITDIRMLMTKGKDNKKWQWSDAGGRGDWLNIQLVTDKVGNRLLPFGWKVAYNSHGPCLSEVFYDGWYSSDRCVGMSANVRTLRTDDYARTFTALNFVFNQSLVATNTSFFCMGGIPTLKTPKIVLGNNDGLIEEYNVPENLQVGTFFVKQRELVGKGPWFIGFPEQCIEDDKKWGKGWRALIIRTFDATFNAVKYNNPSISLQATRKRYSIGTNLNLLITKPMKQCTPRGKQKKHRGKLVESDSFSKGDTLNLEVELITLPRNATDYYGPNKAFGKHLEEKPNSWETVHREALLNTLNVVIRHGGHIKNSYPVIIQAEGGTRIDFVIEGGVGIVPIRFDGLCNRHSKLFRYTQNNIEKELHQEVHGNDFWQTEYDPLTCTYNLAFNVPLDGEPTSQWTLH